MAKAERLKVEEGSVTLGNCLPGETVMLKDETGFAGQGDRARDAQHDHPLRLRETFELLKRKLDADRFLTSSARG